MQQRAAGCCLYPVTERVPEVERASKPAFPLILLDYRALYHQRVVYYSVDILAAVQHYLVKQLGIKARRHLDSLCETAAQLARVERRQHVGVDNYPLRLPERAYAVFYSVHVNAGLAADARIYLREQGSRDIVEIYAAHVSRRCKAGKVADNSSADGNNAVAAGEAALEHLRQHALPYRNALAVLTLRQTQHGRRTRCFCNRAGILCGNTVVGHYHYLAVELKQRADLTQRAASENNVIAARCGPDSDSVAYRKCTVLILARYSHHICEQRRIVRAQLLIGYQCRAAFDHLCFTRWI